MIKRIVHQAGLTTLFRRREQYADDYAYWIAALGEVRSRPPAEARDFLNRKLRERIAATKEDWLAGKDALQVVSVAERRPEAFVQSVDAMRARMERVRQALTRHLKR